jgi:oligopeptide/dipeptide ABC transporter ATP-binding protein
MILELTNISVNYRRPDKSLVTAVDGVSLTLNKGEILGLVGESGCGKSTLGRAAVGILPVAQGEVSFNGGEVKSMARGARAVNLRQLQLVFQDPFSSLNPRRKVGDQLSDGLINLGKSKDEALEKGALLLEKVGLSRSALAKFPHEFSGGQRQRIAIARALVVEPLAIVADEPISALDASAQAQVANLLVELVRETQMGMIFISHDLSVVRQISDRTAVMYLGKIVEVGATDEIWNNPAHPYTRALINAIPLADGSGIIPAELIGDVPDPRFPPTGCRFHPRCSVAIEKCKTQKPILFSVQSKNERQVSCHLQTENSAISIL